MSAKSNKYNIQEYHKQSWQLEMLIAGGILFSLYNFGDDLRAFYLSIYSTIKITSHFMIGFFGAYVLTTVLLFGFGANLILRSVWLAYLGLSYAFADGINYDNIKGSEAYKSKLKKNPTALDRVVYLEKWSKLSYSFAIIVALFVLSLIITSTTVIWLLNVISSGLGDVPITSYIVVILMVLIQLGFLDQLFLSTKEKGRFARISSFSDKLFNIFTLAFLYRREALVLKSNVNKWAFYGFVLLYLFVSITISINRVGDFYSSGTFTFSPFDDRDFYRGYFRSTMSRNRYENTLGPDKKFFSGGIQSDIVKDNYLKLFVVYQENFDWQFKGSFKEFGLSNKYPDSLRTANEFKAHRKNQNEKWQAAINDYLKVYIDSNQVSQIQWAAYKHPVTAEEGYLTYLKIDTLAKSKHYMYVDIRYNLTSGGSQTERLLNIPFWKD